MLNIHNAPLVFMDVYGYYAFVPETLFRICDKNVQRADNEAMLDLRR